jgi:RNA polymerase sigma factor (sigma-70 family)
MIGGKIQWRISASGFDFSAGMDASDSDLLTRYARDGDEDAFATVVNRRLSLVYSAALRLVRTPALAEEVSQLVFLELARAAGKFGSGVGVSTWLYTVTHRRAVDLLRRESSRHRRETGAAILDQNQPKSDGDLLEQCLDSALVELSPTDRAAVLLRYIEGKSLAEVGQALGISENAAQKRVSRGLEMLRARLVSRGVRVGVRGLILVLSDPAPRSPSPKLAAAVVSAAGSLVAPSFSTVAALPVSVMTIKKIILLGAVVLLSCVAVYLARESSRLRLELEGLRNRVAMAESPETRDQTNPPPVDDGKQREFEILRLRGEVARLGRELAESKSKLANPSQAAESAAAIPDDLTGPAATIEASLQRLLKNAQFNDMDRIRPFISWKFDEAVPAKAVEGISNAFPRAILDTFGPNGSSVGIEVLDHWEEFPDMIRARVEAIGRDGRKRPLEMRFAAENGDWKPVITVEQSPAGSTGTTLFLPRSKEQDAP